MCGIGGIIIKKGKDLNICAAILSMAQTISHRGPDGEGFILANDVSLTPFYRQGTQQVFKKKELNFIPKAAITESEHNYTLAFAHRRLSILDLSDSGHQPMCTEDKKLWITFNGEIYNYIELRKELQNAGYLFISESDTEVILQAYKHWGADCVKKFNGMWAFCIYDTEKQMLFASRDRLGVKPFYFINNSNLFCFGSEQKAFVKSGLVKATYTTKVVHNYLVNGLLENESCNFFEGIEELFPGHNLIYSIKNGTISIDRYYKITITDENERLSDKQLINEIEIKLYNAVKLRLRSDVEVGACLSGGIDSSLLTGLMHAILKRSNYCFTSVFKNELFNEEHFAGIAAKKVDAKHIKTEPILMGFINEIDSLVYSQDIPIWDTSTYAQFKVMELSKKNKIKVVIDGQGADELFGGYHHHFVAKWNNLISEGQTLLALKDIHASRKTISNPYIFYAKEKIKNTLNVNTNILKDVFKNDFLNSRPINKSVNYKNNVNEQLIDDIEHTRLKSFLKCEDRCGMWHGVESRTPFSEDVELIDFMFSFNGNRKIQNGISKYLLREAGKSVLPKEIYNRYDKKGFETPMKKWLTELKPQIISEIKAASFDFINTSFLEKMNTDNNLQLRIFFKLFILSRWQKVFKA
ncbi:MAG: asparagine synthase (glutamine-hydrolyzing) [Bacteroidetes bacterium]|nr:asparagine synthase (glutamine-hydrolyzing) [Bacteroidota bacterium]